MKKLPRNKVLIAVAASVLAATMVMGREKPAAEVVEAARVERKSEPLVDLDLAKLERSGLSSGTSADPFAARSFNPQPVQQQAAAQQPQGPSAPEAPPLPFRYIGHLVEDGKTYVFLAHGEEAITTQTGQKLAGNDWRLDKITEQEVVLTYLPLKKKHSIPL